MNTEEFTYFDVSENGTLSLVDCYKPKTRKDFYDLPADCKYTRKRLVKVAEELPPLQWLIASCYTSYRENPAYPARLESMSEEPEDEWIDWVLKTDKKTFSSLCKETREWLFEEPDWGCEDHYFVVSGDPERAAFDLLENEPIDLLDALGIVIIEGDYPGSDYCGAELSCPVEEANAIAEAEGMEYRFQRKTKEYTRGTDERKEKILSIQEAIFALIPAGAFTMGSTWNERDGKNVETEHRVTISKPFYIQSTPLTQGQWQKVMGYNPSHFRGDDNLPVECVSWNDAQKFISKLNSMDGSYRYLLPTEAQWEYACRAGSKTAYCFGDDPGDLGEYAWIAGIAGSSTHPVGQKMPNAWGLHDMHGNVWEWVEDWWADFSSGSVTDPRGPSSGSHRVMRGGSWYSAAPKTHNSAYRGRGDQGKRHDYLGFRLIRTD